MRQDETSREEIWQDVIRCNIDNYFFREPSTQKRLLDILFIYSKLNPDTGYRQGMHELLAPILWVIYQDSVDVKAVPSTAAAKEGTDFMLEVLDSRYVEHDAFNLFCAVMQTAKTFYEIGENKDSSAIIAQSERIHQELLGAVDPDLCHHLQVIGIVPQIFAIRWLRLLFGREFEFKNVLKLWDILFAESLNVDIIDMACVAILLRLRWQLIDADYTTAITTLTRLNLPKEGDSARAIVKDAVQLSKRRNAEAGADITQLRTGKRQYTNPLSTEEPVIRTSTPSQARTHRRLKSSHASPSPSPARFTTPQRQLESLFNNVSSNFQKGAEGWSVQNVSKALRGAVGEVRRNVEQLQVGTSHSRGASVDVSRGSPEDEALPNGIAIDLADRLKKLEERNKALAKMLDTAQESLRKWKSESSIQNTQGEDAFNTALAKIQFVSVYLADSDIPIPALTPAAEKTPSDHVNPITAEADQEANKDQLQKQEKAQEISTTPSSSQEPANTSTTNLLLQPPSLNTPSTSPPPTHPTRPSLAESSFSFMLGSDRHRSSFVRSTPLPEERRHSEAAAAAAKEHKNSNDKEERVKKKKDKKERRGSGVKNGDDSDEDGFTLSSLKGGKVAGPL